MLPTRAREKLGAGIFTRLAGFGKLATSPLLTQGHLHNLHSKMDTNLAHKYLQVPVIASKPCKTPNLHRIYKNLREFTPLFEEFTKIYVIYSVNCSAPPPICYRLGHPSPLASTFGVTSH